LEKIHARDTTGNKTRSHRYSDHRKMATGKIITSHCLAPRIPKQRDTEVLNSVRNLGHSYLLPLTESTVFKNSFPNRCLFFLYLCFMSLPVSCYFLLLSHCICRVFAMYLSTIWHCVGLTCIDLIKGTLLTYLRT